MTTYRSFLGLSLADAMTLAASWGMTCEYHEAETMGDWTEPAWLEVSGDDSCGSCALYFEDGACSEFERLGWL